MRSVQRVAQVGDARGYEADLAVTIVAAGQLGAVQGIADSDRLFEVTVGAALRNPLKLSCAMAAVAARDPMRAS